MNTDLRKRFEFACGLTFLLTGCVFLIVFAFMIQNTIASGEKIISSICLLAFIAILFIISANSFIKYGIALGIDYALDKQKQK